MARVFTHVVKTNGGQLVSTIGHRVERDRFAAPLRRRDDRERWGLGLFPLPDGVEYDEMLVTGEEFTEYLQAAGAADALTVEIRKPGGEQWGCRWMRYVVGHRDQKADVLDVEIAIPTGRLHVSAAEVFDAEEAADLFETYHRSGDIPADYALRPVEGYRADGSTVEIP